MGGFGRVTGTGECSPAAGWCEWVAGGFLVYPGVREEVRQMASAGAGSAGVEVARGGVMNSPRHAGNGRRAGRLAALGAGVVVRKKAASAGAGWAGGYRVGGLAVIGAAGGAGGAGSTAADTGGVRQFTPG